MGIHMAGAGLGALRELSKLASGSIAVAVDTEMIEFGIQSTVERHLSSKQKSYSVL